jgi:transposase InsO family protein
MIYDESNGILGARKIHHILKQHGEVISLKMVKELMHKMGLKSIRSITAKERLKEKRKKFKKENLLKNVFTADAPNTIWVSDITQYCFLDYRVFICVILDLYSRKVLAYKVSKKQTTQLFPAHFKWLTQVDCLKNLFFTVTAGVNIHPLRFEKNYKLCMVRSLFLARERQGIIA